MNTFAEDRSVLTRPAPPPDEVVHYGEGEQQIADVSYGIGSAAARPLVLFVHGGFWRPQFDRTHGGPLRTAIAGSGWTIASIEYRRIPGDPEVTLNDITSAIEKMPSLVANHNGRLVISGHSAGGHLVLWAASNLASKRLAGVLALAPAADLQAAATRGIGDRAVSAFVGNSRIALKDLDPTQMAKPTTTVAIVHGEQDEVVPIALSENYSARHAGTRLTRVEDCGHFALIDPQSNAWPRVLDELRRLT